MQLTAVQVPREQHFPSHFDSWKSRGVTGLSALAAGDKSLGRKHEQTGEARAALTILHTQARTHTMRQLASDCVKWCKQEACRRTWRFVIGPPRASEYSRTMQPEELKIHRVTGQHVDTYSNFQVLLCQVCASVCESVACAVAASSSV